MYLASTSSRIHLVGSSHEVATAVHPNLSAKGSIAMCNMALQCRRAIGFILTSVCSLGRIGTTERLSALMARLEALGARRVERVDAPGQEIHWIWADPDGNAFCAPGL